MGVVGNEQLSVGDVGSVSVVRPFGDGLQSEEYVADWMLYLGLQLGFVWVRVAVSVLKTADFFPQIPRQEPRRSCFHRHVLSCSNC